VVCLARSKVPNLLLFRTLAAVVALEISGILVMLCAVSCCCSCCCCVIGVVVVVVFFLFLYCLSALGVGYFAVTNVTFSALFVGFFSALFVGLCIPLCRVM
jgi:hypothetical protein